MNRRLPVSPYARRLAAERGVALDGLVGSGPGGRLVAADIPSRPAANIPAAPAAPSPEPPCLPVAPVAAAVVLPAVHGATAALSALNHLLAQLAAAGREVAREDVVLRAVALALAAREAGPLALETGSGSIDLAGADRLTVSAIRARRARGGNDIGTAAALSLRFASRPGLHSLMLPLKPGIPMRLSVSFATDGALADLVLAHDPATVEEDRAEALLATLRDGLEAPLGLFV